jgi:hypothetical protein
MALNKVTYVDNVTVIGATNLNAIQDEIIANGTSIGTLSSGKVDKVTGKGLSTNDFTSEMLSKLNGIENEANKTIVDNAMSATSENPVQNKVVKENLDVLTGDMSDTRLLLSNVEGNVKTSPNIFSRVGYANKTYIYTRSVGNTIAYATSTALGTFKRTIEIQSGMDYRLSFENAGSATCHLVVVDENDIVIASQNYTTNGGYVDFAFAVSGMLCFDIPLTATNIMIQDGISRVSEYEAYDDKTYGITLNKAVTQVPTYEEYEYASGKITDSYPVNTLEDQRVATFDDGTDGVDVESLTVYVQPNQLGEGTPSPTNIRRFSYPSPVIINRASKNLIGGIEFANQVKRAVQSASINTESKYVSFVANATVTSGVGQLSALNYKENTAYTFIMTFRKNTGVGSNMRIVYTDGTSDIIPAVSEPNVKGTTRIVSKANKSISYLGKQNSSGTTYLYYDECGIFEGNVALEDFVPYEGDVYTIEIPVPDAPHLYRFGVLDVTTGVFTYTHLLATMDGENNKCSAFTASGDGHGYALTYNGSGAISKYTSSTVRIWSSHYKGVSYSNRGDRGEDLTIFISSSAGGTKIRHDAFDAEDDPVEAFNAYLAEQYSNGTPVQVYCVIKEDVVFQVSPVLIKTLRGLNNINAYGYNIDITYRALTGKHIDKVTKNILSMLAQVEDGETASQAYAIGEYFVHNDQFCKAKTAIASGATFTLGTNYEATTVAAELLSALS